jgi:hypothetical protein
LPVALFSEPRDYNFDDLPFRMINCILDFLIFQIKEINDLVYIFRLDKFRKVFYYRNILVIHSENLYIYLKNFKNNKKIKYMKITSYKNIISRLRNNLEINKLAKWKKNIISEIPENLEIDELQLFVENTISEIPKNPKIKNLVISGTNTISEIPDKLKMNKLYICGDNTISEIPDNLEINELTIVGLNKISNIPNNLKMNKLRIGGNNTISEIPGNLKINELYIDFEKYDIKNHSQSRYFLY